MAWGPKPKHQAKKTSVWGGHKPKHQAKKTSEVMPRKRYKPEEIPGKLRQVDDLVSQGQSLADALRHIGISEQTYYRKLREFDQMEKYLKERDYWRRAVADLVLEKVVLQERIEKNF